MNAINKFFSHRAYQKKRASHQIANPLFSYKHQFYRLQVALQQSLFPLQIDGRILILGLMKLTNLSSVHYLFLIEAS
jgi:hypothetical protein